MSITNSNTSFNTFNQFPNSREGIISKLQNIQSTYITEIIREHRESLPLQTQRLSIVEIDQAKLAKLRATILLGAFNGDDIPAIKVLTEKSGMPQEMVIPTLVQFKFELDKGIKTADILSHLINSPVIMEVPDVLTMPPNANVSNNIRSQKSLPDVLAAPPNATSRLHLPQFYDM